MVKSSHKSVSSEEFSLVEVSTSYHSETCSPSACCCCCNGRGRAPSTPVNAERVSQITGTPALEEQKGHHSNCECAYGRLSVSQHSVHTWKHSYRYSKTSMTMCRRRSYQPPYCLKREAMQSRTWLDRAWPGQERKDMGRLSVRLARGVHPENKNTIAQRAPRSS